MEGARNAGSEAGGGGSRAARGRGTGADSDGRRQRWRLPVPEGARLQEDPLRPGRSSEVAPGRGERPRGFIQTQEPVRVGAQGAGARRLDGTRRIPFAENGGRQECWIRAERLWPSSRR